MCALRFSFATHLLLSSTGIRTVSELFIHSDVRPAVIYANVI